MLQRASNASQPGYGGRETVDAGRLYTERGIALAGPVRIQGAEPGDALAVRVLEILTRDWAVAGYSPGRDRAMSGVLGGQSDDVEDNYLVHLSLDRARGVWKFGERVEVPLAPFMGVLGVAPARGSRTPTAHPGPHGGNIDCKELRAGTTLFLPVFVSGALFSVGDGHGAQGDGEVDGAAVETGMERLVLEFGLVKGAGLKRPRAETDTHLIFLAFDEDLDAAVLEAARDVMGYLTARRGLTRHEAYSLASIAADFRISQVVNGLKGVHAMLPKALFGGCAN
jgi:acetamidase/formamidase